MHTSFEELAAEVIALEQAKSTNEKVRYQGSCSSARPTVLGSSTGIGDDLPALAVGEFHEAVERGAVAAAGEDLVPSSNGEIGWGVCVVRRVWVL
jgi:hypothetical protein